MADIVQEQVTSIQTDTPERALISRISSADP